MNTPSPSPIQEARALLNELQSRFTVFRDCLPLAIGIDKQLFVAMPETAKKSLRLAVSLHTNSFRYLKAMQTATARFNLDGTKAADLEELHRKHAAGLLRARDKRVLEKKQAEEANAVARRREEKLRQLADKFSSRR